MKKTISVFLAAVMLFTFMQAAYADEPEPYCTLGCENNTITLEMFTTGIYSLSYDKGNLETVTFRYVYDKNILSVDELNEDGAITLIIEPKLRSDTYLRIEMLAEDGSIAAQENLTVKIKSYPLGDIIKSMFSTAEYFSVLNFVYILPELISIPFRYITAAAENLREKFILR